ncbi:hypothetical protein [Acholeplasma equifetale]|jgi:hypothetical protein|uniref:hypothetical protein n=1 Tax=Acholeplasma equifetale TaxID=264634 RepID=UPI000479290B|nr:hypothetical protein [Acholeplasma equifetale]
MANKVKKQSNFKSWLLKYRVKIGLALLLITLPVAYVTALYLGNYIRYNEVEFDGEKISSFEKTYITIEDETNHEIINLETNDLIIQIKLVEIKQPQYENPGYYTFKAKVVDKTDHLIENVQITMILSTKWMNAKSQPRSLYPTNNFSSNISLDFKERLPKSPLWFVTVHQPHLYVKVSYQTPIALEQVKSITHYFSTDLYGLTPSVIVDNQNK